MEKNYFNEVSEIEANAKIEYKELCDLGGKSWSDFGERAYLHGYMSARLATALRDIDKLKSQIK